MRTENIYDAISGLDEKYVTASDNSDAIRLSFRKNRAHKIKMIGTVCACTVVVMVSGWIGSQGWFGKKPPTEQNTFVPQESASVSDNRTTGKTQDWQTTVTEQPTEPVKEMESRIQKTENHTQTVTTGNQNRLEPTTKALQTDAYSTTKPSQTEVHSTTNPPTTSKSEAVFYLKYTYFIVDSAFSAYRPGKVVGEEMVGERLENASATGVYIFSDGRTEEDETLRCEIFALTGVDPGIAVCVRFIDKGKGLTTDHYYLLYNPTADTSTIEAYLIPQTEANNEE